MRLFDEIFEQEAIGNIQKFSRIADMEGLKVEVGFSGGKDSIVTYDLCKRSGINFTPVFKYAFESPDVVQFIKREYPEVVMTKKKLSYFQLIKQRNILPTARARFCCDYFKENSKNAVIIGVRRQESVKRRERKLFAIKGKKNIGKYTSHFTIGCTESGQSPLQLLPILQWQTVDIWDYIHKYNLPYPDLYNDGNKRCGCMLCPLTGLKNNMYYIQKYPNLLPAFYENVAKNIKRDYIFNKGRDSEENLSDQPYKYLLYWLSASFRPSEKDKQLINEYLKTNNLWKI